MVQPEPLGGGGHVGQEPLADAAATVCRVNHQTVNVNRVPLDGGDGETLHTLVPECDPGAFPLAGQLLKEMRLIPPISVGLLIEAQELAHPIPQSVAAQYLDRGQPMTRRRPNRTKSAPWSGGAAFAFAAEFRCRIVARKPSPRKAAEIVSFPETVSATET